MERPVSEIVLLIVEVIVTLLLLGVIGAALSVGGSAVSAYNRSVDMQVRMEEYAAYSMYDGTEVSGADIATAVVKYALNEGVELWVANSSPSAAPVRLPDASVVPVSQMLTDNLFSLGSDYNASLIVSPNGDVIGLRFIIIIP